MVFKGQEEAVVSPPGLRSRILKIFHENAEHDALSAAIMKHVQMCPGSTDYAIVEGVRALMVMKLKYEKMAADMYLNNPAPLILKVPDEGV